MSQHVDLYPLPEASTVGEACEAAASQLTADILLIHATITMPFGRTTIIFPQLLDSAVHRPFAVFGDTLLYQSGLDQASALLQSLIQNHAFQDGNKRTAITSCLFFLERCGFWQDVALLTEHEARELEQLTLILAREKTLVQNGTLSAKPEIADIAEAMDDILGPSRNRRERAGRTGRLKRITDMITHTE